MITVVNFMLWIFDHSKKEKKSHGKPAELVRGIKRRKECRFLREDGKIIRKNDVLDYAVFSSCL